MKKSRGVSFKKLLTYLFLAVLSLLLLHVGFLLLWGVGATLHAVHRLLPEVAPFVVEHGL